jgi:hypothetical protein
MVSLKLWEVECKPQQVASFYLNLLKNRVVLNPRWNFVDTYVYLYDFFPFSVLLARYFYCLYSAHKYE